MRKNSAKRSAKRRYDPAVVDAERREATRWMQIAADFLSASGGVSVDGIGFATERVVTDEGTYYLRLFRPEGAECGLLVSTFNAERSSSWVHSVEPLDDYYAAMTKAASGSDEALLLASAAYKLRMKRDEVAPAPRGDGERRLKAVRAR